MCDASIPRRAISASSSRAMRGMRTWTIARSTDRCSRISSSIVSATPTSTSVAGTTRSESALIVSVKSARHDALSSRSNSSRKIASGRGRASASSPRTTACGVTRASPSTTLAGWVTSVVLDAKPMPCASECSAISPSAFRQIDVKSSPESHVARATSTLLDASSSAVTDASDVLPTPRSP